MSFFGGGGHCSISVIRQFMSVPLLGLSASFIRGGYCCIIVEHNVMIRQYYVHPLNISQKSFPPQEVIEERYGVQGEELRCYVHYQPSYYHFHVHFTHLRYCAPRVYVGQSHLLEEIIDNIEIDSEYYTKRTLSYVGKRDSPLWFELQKLRQSS